MWLNNFDRIECHAICGKFEISMTTTQAAKVYLFWLIDPFLVSAILILMTTEILRVVKNEGKFLS